MALLMGAVVVGCSSAPSGSGGGSAAKGFRVSATSASFGAGEGSITGARTLMSVTDRGQAPIVKRVTQGDSSVDHTFFVADDTLKIGNRNNQSGSFTLGTTGTLRVLLGYENDASYDTTVDVSLTHRIAIYKAINKDRSDGNWQGNFGRSRCATFLSGDQSGSANTLKQALVRNGYRATNARLFGTQFSDNGSTIVYRLSTLATDSDGLAKSGDSGVGNRALYRYGGTAPVATGLTIAQLVDVESGGGWKSDSGTSRGKVIEDLIGASGTFWSLSTDNNTDAPRSCRGATVNSSFNNAVSNDTTGNYGDKDSVDGTTDSGIPDVTTLGCNHWRSVLCVAR